MTIKFNNQQINRLRYTIICRIKLLDSRVKNYSLNDRLLKAYQTEIEELTQLLTDKFD